MKMWEECLRLCPDHPAANYNYTLALWQEVFILCVPYFFFFFFACVRALPHCLSGLILTNFLWRCSVVCVCVCVCVCIL